ncbi:hypothetical protein AAFF_G00041430 [Aldrovandia affinis]|uniref:Uncharacterized protein n=1 Tax=Aldrovandia affinis TaxID=143900 RepID=A0AAD7S2R0_9TELE|nr:hypothetical protein AAFF_G00041430 [Aldrovandia affinis]
MPFKAARSTKRDLNGSGLQSHPPLLSATWLRWSELRSAPGCSARQVHAAQCTVVLQEDLHMHSLFSRLKFPLSTSLHSLIFMGLGFLATKVAVTLRGFRRPVAPRKGTRCYFEVFREGTVTHTSVEYTSRSPGFGTCAEQREQRTARPISATGRCDFASPLPQDTCRIRLRPPPLPLASFIPTPGSRLGRQEWRTWCKGVLSLLGLQQSQTGEGWESAPLALAPLTADRTGVSTDRGVSTPAVDSVISPPGAVSTPRRRAALPFITETGACPGASPEPGHHLRQEFRQSGREKPAGKAPHQHRLTR